jgi:thiol-disulfide isomerase/thioredoxin
MKPVLPLTKIERLLIIILSLLAIAVFAGGILLILYPSEKEKGFSQSSGNPTEWRPEEVNPEDNYLDDKTSLLPDFCNLNEKIPDISIEDENGRVVSVKEWEGKVTILTFWASWCPDCQKEMSSLNQFLDIAKAYGDINYVLINKLDDKKETKAKASQYLSQQGIGIRTYYDNHLKAYDKLGLHNIPTTLFLDKQGIIRAWSSKQITDASVFEGLLKDTIEGSGKVTCDFVTANMMDNKGGVHTIYNTSREKTENSDVLSETQGGMLEYAVLRKDRELFDKTFSYITSEMNLSGLTAWKVTGGKPANVNSLLDDLRIMDALFSANRLWGGYEEPIRNYISGFARFGVKDGRYVDFYDRKYKRYANRFTLCYGDLKTMSELALQDESLKEPYENAKKLILEGKISESFPLYYSWYNLKTNQYETDDLNMAEALVTLLHLAEADLLPKESIAWLKEEMNKEGIKARYTVEGKVVDGYYYDSTAIYALTAMIAERIGDKDLQGKALRKMETMRIVNTSHTYHGAFGMEDGTGITAFDQIMAMLAYEYTN